MLGLGTGTTSAITGTSHLSAANRLGYSGAVLIVLRPHLLTTRGSAAVHGYEKHEAKTKNQGKKKGTDI